jgi:hypothetical protein
MFQTEVVERKKNYVSETLSENDVVYEVKGKYGRARHATGDNILRRMRVACWITGDTHVTCNTVFIFRGDSYYANAPQC